MNAKVRRPDECMRCGSFAPTAHYYSDTLSFKGLTLDVDGLVESRCSKCGFAWVTEGQEQDNLRLLRDAYAARRDQVRARDGLLMAQEIEQALRMLGLSRADAAEVFGGGPNAFQKYLSGEVLQSVPMDRLLRLAVSFGPAAVLELRSCKGAALELNSGFRRLVASAPTYTRESSHEYATSESSGTTARVVTSEAATARARSLQ